ncbi:hypothetical protein [Maribacter halichondriae]|uniref:hypothetical protein n=1 Tax=Maribacter halichondriae TaxID=2980554 RepID=UPI0023599BF9|nr:hypothetical protein [Maribacter sp. Hal144]
MEVFYLTYLITLVQLLAAIWATISFKKYRHSAERYFLHFLWFTVGIEITAGVLSDVFSIDTYWLYNFYMVVSFLFFFYWYYTILRTKTQKKAILVFVLIFIGMVIWDFMYRDELGYQEFTFVSGAFLIMICTMFHFRQLLYSDEVLVLKHKLSFWISTGLLLFNMGMIPLMLLTDYFDFGANKYYLTTIIGLNFILNGCYIIGFQWTKEKYNRF